MSFLDNLENTLKAMESREERNTDDQKRRASERAQALAAAPWAEALKKSAYAKELMSQATRAGYKVRSKVYIVWLGTILRLEARDRKLELRPLADGIVAVFIENNAETASRKIDLNGNPEELVNQWLSELTAPAGPL